MKNVSHSRFYRVADLIERERDRQTPSVIDTPEQSRTSRSNGSGTIGERFVAISPATNRNLIGVHVGRPSSPGSRTSRQTGFLSRGRHRARKQSGKRLVGANAAPGADPCEGYYPVGGSHLLCGRNTNDARRTDKSISRYYPGNTNAYWERGVYIRVYL